MTSNDKSEVFHIVLPSIMTLMDKSEVFNDIVAMMRKVMHHSEEIHLFVLINKLTTHFISEPPHGFVFSDLVRHMSYWFLRNQLF